MKAIRAVIRTLRVLLATFIGYGSLLLSRPIAPVAPKRARRLRNWGFRAWGRALCRIFRIRLRIEGKAPEGRFFLVSNHVGYLDIPLLGRAVDAAFVAKADLRGWPFLGTVFAAADTIFIDRARKKDLLRVMEQARSALERNLGVVLFAEGTSGKGDCILPLKPSILQLAIEAEVPVYYATLEYATVAGGPPPSDSVCWWGDEPFFPHYRRLVKLDRIDAVLRFGAEPVRASDRKELAQSLHASMSAQFEPMP